MKIAKTAFAPKNAPARPLSTRCIEVTPMGKWIKDAIKNIALTAATFGISLVFTSNLALMALEGIISLFALSFIYRVKKDLLIC